MTSLRFTTVDVFTSRAFAGNALCVVLDACPETLWQPIAREANLSETTFVTSRREGHYSMRIFTPTAELPFAGHPSLGTAWVLGPGRWVQQTPGATVTIEADAAGATMGQPDPELVEVQDVARSEVAAALGLAGVEGVWRSTAGGVTHILVPTTADVAGALPDHAAVARLAAAAGGMSLAPFRRVDDRTLHARVFVPGMGIAEDPGTGSAAGPIGVLARRLWGTDADIEIRQGEEMRRPCVLRVHALDGDLRVGGDVVASAEGVFHVPPA